MARSKEGRKGKKKKRPSTSEQNDDIKGDQVEEGRSRRSSQKDSTSQEVAKIDTSKAEVEKDVGIAGDGKESGELKVDKEDGPKSPKNGKETVDVKLKAGAVDNDAGHATKDLKTEVDGKDSSVMEEEKEEGEIDNDVVDTPQSVRKEKKRKKQGEETEDGFKKRKGRSKTRSSQSSVKEELLSFGGSKSVEEIGTESKSLGKGEEQKVNETEKGTEETLLDDEDQNDIAADKIEEGSDSKMKDRKEGRKSGRKKKGGEKKDRKSHSPEKDAKLEVKTEAVEIKSPRQMEEKKPKKSHTIGKDEETKLEKVQTESKEVKSDKKVDTKKLRKSHSSEKEESKLEIETGEGKGDKKLEEKKRRKSQSSEREETKVETDINTAEVKSDRKCEEKKRKKSQSSKDEEEKIHEGMSGGSDSGLVEKRRKSSDLQEDEERGTAKQNSEEERELGKEPIKEDDTKEDGEVVDDKNHKKVQMDEVEDGEVEDDDDEKTAREPRDRRDYRHKESTKAERSGEDDQKVEGVKKGSLIIFKRDTSSKKVYAPVKTKRTSLKSKDKKDDEEEKDENKPRRKRRWGSTKTHSSKKKPNVNISTNVLKEIMPDIKGMQAELEVELETVDAMEMEKAQEEIAIESHKERGRRVTITKKVKSPETNDDEEMSEKEMSDIDDGDEPPAPTKDAYSDGEKDEAKSPAEAEEEKVAQQQSDEEAERDKRPMKEKNEKKRKEIYSDDDDELSDIPLDDEEEEREMAKKKEVEMRKKLTLKRQQIQDVLRASIDEPIRGEKEKLFPSKFPATSILHIMNLVRPFTIPQLKTLLGRYGTLSDGGFWINNIKSHCYATFVSKEDAEKCRDALHRAKWPQSNPKSMNIEFATESELDRHLGKIPPLMPKEPEPLLPKRARSPLKSRSRREDEENRANRERDRENLGLQRNSSEKERDVGRVKERRLSEREWDRGKDRSPQRNRTPDRIAKRRREKDISRERDTKKENKQKSEEPPAKMLDDLFRKTMATPCIYWLPLSEEKRIQENEATIMDAENGRQERYRKMEQFLQRNKERDQARSRSPQRRSPVRRSPIRRSPVRRSPVRQSPARRSNSRNRGRRR